MPEEETHVLVLVDDINKKVDTVVGRHSDTHEEAIQAFIDRTYDAIDEAISDFHEIFRRVPEPLALETRNQMRHHALALLVARLEFLNACIDAFDPHASHTLH